MHQKFIPKIFFLSALVLLFAPQIGLAQQPAPRPDKLLKTEPKTYVGQGLENGLGVNLIINNFGFGIGGEYRRFVEPYTDMTLSLDITGVRNVSEQTFQTIFGQQIIPNKYNRVLAFPLRVGVRHRFFANEVTDNFRIYLSGQLGPALTFVYPYFKDVDNSGYRNTGNIYSTDQGFNIRDTYEQPNDFFTGWKDGDFELGVSGKLMVAFDFGENFDRLTSVEFGWFFYYYPRGIQIMEPMQINFNEAGDVELDDNGNIETKSFYDKQKYLGTPQITLTFGNLW